MECPLDETGSFLDTRTGEVVNISFEDLRAAENDKPIEQFPEWQQEAQLAHYCIS